MGDEGFLCEVFCIHKQLLVKILGLSKKLDREKDLGYNENSCNLADPSRNERGGDSAPN